MAATAQRQVDHPTDKSVRRPTLGNRKSSFSEALNKFTSSSFTRRIFPTTSSSSTSVRHQSRIPTPAGIPRSTSFFSSFNTFTSQSTSVSNQIDLKTSDESNNENTIKRSRKISERLAQSSFFGHQYKQQKEEGIPVTSRNERPSSVKIQQRGLMQPMHPPLPRSSTMGNLGAQNSPRTPGFMRPTSSSTRRNSITVQKQRSPLSPAAKTTKTITKRTSTPIAPEQPTRRSGAFPSRRDRLFLPLAQKSASSSSHEEEGASPLPPINLTSTPDYNSDDNVCGVRADHLAGEVDSHEEGDLTEEEMTHTLTRCKGNEKCQEEAQEDSTTPMSPTFTEALSNDDDDSRILPNHHAPETDTSNPRLIHTAHPPTYWLGRHTALSDRFRSNALPPSPSSNPSTPFSPTFSSEATLQNSKNNSMHDAAKRNKRVFIHLRSLCTTEEARESLKTFRALWEERERRISGAAGEAEGASSGKKKGFLEGLGLKGMRGGGK